MTLATILSFGAVAVLYLFIGIKLKGQHKTVADLIPIRSGHFARIDHSSEFSSSTAAATISLATVVLAFFELASYFGPWLFWTVVTTALGIYVVSRFSSRIWLKLSSYGDRRPTLRAYAGPPHRCAVDASAGSRDRAARGRGVGRCLRDGLHGPGT